MRSRLWQSNQIRLCKYNTSHLIEWLKFDSFLPVFDGNCFRVLIILFLSGNSIHHNTSTTIESFVTILPERKKIEILLISITNAPTTENKLNFFFSARATSTAYIRTRARIPLRAGWWSAGRRKGLRVVAALPSILVHFLNRQKAEYFSGIGNTLRV